MHHAEKQAVVKAPLPFHSLYSTGRCQTGTETMLSATVNRHLETGLVRYILGEMSRSNNVLASVRSLGNN